MHSQAWCVTDEARTVVGLIPASEAKSETEAVALCQEYYPGNRNKKLTATLVTAKATRRSLKSPLQGE
jgi:hypothetical protein